MREEKELTNPFYHNYAFSCFDLNRPFIKWYEWIYLWMLPTYVQLNEGLEFHFKLCQGRIFLIEVKNMESATSCNS